jgi:pimeloyl-ACP methyl ester carboxylesterase
VTPPCGKRGDVSGRYWRTRPGTRGHVFPANWPSFCVFSVCACPRLPNLLYPSRTRGLLSVLRTDNDGPVAIDLPAHGESGGAPGPLDQVAAQVRELLASLSVERPIMVGHSMMGGLAALYAAAYERQARRPERRYEWEGTFGAGSWRNRINSPTVWWRWWGWRSGSSPWSSYRLRRPSRVFVR